MGKCKRCEAYVPDGKNLCHSHYQQALVEYQDQLDQYNRNVQEWERLSDLERGIHNRQAEKDQITVISGIVGLLLGIIIWVKLNSTQKIDGLIGIAIVVASVVFFTAIEPIRVFVGRFIRFIYMAVGYMILLSVITFLLSLFSDFLKEHKTAAYTLAFVGSIILSLVKELSGAHHASAKPVKPTMPKP